MNGFLEVWQGLEKIGIMWSLKTTLMPINTLSISRGIMYSTVMGCSE
jgi:hypothetical protein